MDLIGMIEGNIGWVLIVIGLLLWVAGILLPIIPHFGPASELKAVGKYVFIFGVILFVIIFVFGLIAGAL